MIPLSIKHWTNNGQRRVTIAEESGSPFARTLDMSLEWWHRYKEAAYEGSTKEAAAAAMMQEFGELR